METSSKVINKQLIDWLFVRVKMLLNRHTWTTNMLNHVIIGIHFRKHSRDHSNERHSIVIKSQWSQCIKPSATIELHSIANQLSIIFLSSEKKENVLTIFIYRLSIWNGQKRNHKTDINGFSHRLNDEQRISQFIVQCDCDKQKRDAEFK